MKKNDAPLKGLIEQLQNLYGWRDPLDGVRLSRLWEGAVGGVIANHTTKLEFKKGIIYATIDSSVIRSELHHSRTLVVERLNRGLAERKVKELVLF